MSRPQEPIAARTAEVRCAPAGGVFGGRLSTVLLVLGSVLVILCWFLDMADAAGIERARSELETEEQAVRREGDQLSVKRRKLDDDRRRATDRGPAGETARKDLESRARELDEEEKRHAQKELDWADTRLKMQRDADAAKARYWRDYYYFHFGLMIGLFLILAGALGYQLPHHPLLRRIVGAVLLCGVVLYVLSSYLGSGTNLFFRALLR